MTSLAIFRLFNRFDRFKVDDVIVYLKPSASE